MLNYHHGVSDVTESLQHSDKSLCITRMKTDTRLIKYVKRAYQGAAQRSHKIDSLALSSRQCIRCTVQCKIPKSDILDASQTRNDLLDGLGHYLCIIFR